MDTFQRTISIIESERAKNPTFLQKEIDTGNTNNAHHGKDLYVNSLQQTVLMMLSIPPSRSPTFHAETNTAALVGIEHSDNS